MSVPSTTRTARVPAQAGPVEPPAAPPAAPAAPAARQAPAAPLLGRDRPLTADERQCLAALTGLCVVLGTIVVVFLLLAQHVW